MEKKLNVVSVCFEAMLAQRFHIYSGGLGVVQAGILKSAGRREWPVNIYGLGILWKEGYYDQKIGPNGMEAHYMPRNYSFIEDTGKKIAVEIMGKTNTVKIWRVPPDVFRTAPLILLDTDLEENDELARLNTRHLYGGNEETRLAQEIILGIGGVRAFEALGIPIDLWHGQEGHSIFIAIELLSKNLQSGMPQAEALAAVKRRFVFTTHTPEIAGNETHDIDLMIRMGCFPGIPRELAAVLGKSPFDNRFNMTAAALRLARKANAVSKLHLETTKGMWSWMDEERCPLIHVTNGVDEDWQYPDFKKASTPDELKAVKAKHHERMLRYIEKLRPDKKFEHGKDILTIIWARRMAYYKRAWMILLDWPWLEKLLWNDTLRLIVTGKPYPYDMRSIQVFNDFYKKSQKVPNLIVLPGYEYEQSKILKAGAHLWLGTPRRPQEACSTSGMSANMLGAINIACRDGWLGSDESPEGNHFLFGVTHRCSTEGEQDTIDYKDLVRVLGEAEQTYHDKDRWYSKALAAKRSAEERFNSDRMLRQYIEEMYLAQ